MNDTPNNLQQQEPAAWWAARTDTDFAQITLYRVNGAQEELLDRITVTPETVPSLEDFQMMVKAEHGGGIYLAVQRGPQGQFTMRERFAVAGFPKKPTPPAEEPRQAEAGGLTQLAELLMRQQAASEERMERLLERLAARPEGDELERLERFNRIVNPGAQPQAKEKSLIEQAMEKQFLAFLDNQVGGGGGGDDWWKDIAATFAPALLASAGIGAQAAPAATDGQATAAPATQPTQQQLIQRLTLLLRAMVEMAACEAPPAKTVARIQAQAGALWPNLLAVLQREDAVALAAQLVPEVAQHAEWFTAWRAVVLGETTTEKNDGGDAGDKPQPRARSGGRKRPSGAAVGG